MSGSSPAPSAGANHIIRIIIHEQNTDLFHIARSDGGRLQQGRTITTDVEQVPIITFDTDPAVYPVKVGREFTITPSYQFVDRAVYSWKLEETGKIISTEPQAHLPVRLRQ